MALPEDRFRLVEGERQVGCAELANAAFDAQPRQADRGIRPGLGGRSLAGTALRSALPRRPGPDLLYAVVSVNGDACRTLEARGRTAQHQGAQPTTNDSLRSTVRRSQGARRVAGERTWLLVLPKRAIA